MVSSTRLVVSVMTFVLPELARHCENVVIVLQNMASIMPRRLARQAELGGYTQRVAGQTLTGMKEKKLTHGRRRLAYRP